MTFKCAKDIVRYPKIKLSDYISSLSMNQIEELNLALKIALDIED